MSTEIPVAGERLPADIVRPLVRTRQYREFTDQAVDDAEIDAITDAARWSGSSQNSQPWRFVVIRDADVVREIADSGLPHTRGLRTARLAIAIAMPDDPSRSVSIAFDEGRATERILIAASMLGLGAGISWIRSEVRPVVARLLALPEGRFVRTIVAVGHPSPGARAAKSPPGQARRPREETVFEERWRDG
jgi:nitroreductase